MQQIKGHTSHETTARERFAVRTIAYMLATKAVARRLVSRSVRCFAKC